MSNNKTAYVEFTYNNDDENNNKYDINVTKFYRNDEISVLNNGIAVNMNETNGNIDSVNNEEIKEYLNENKNDTGLLNEINDNSDINESYLNDVNKEKNILDIGNILKELKTTKQNIEKIIQIIGSIIKYIRLSISKESIPRILKIINDTTTGNKKKMLENIYNIINDNSFFNNEIFSNFEKKIIIYLASIIKNHELNVDKNIVIQKIKKILGEEIFLGEEFSNYIDQNVNITLDKINKKPLYQINNDILYNDLQTKIIKNSIDNLERNIETKINNLYRKKGGSKKQTKKKKYIKKYKKTRKVI
jgi:hypothetical protein